MSLTFIKLLLFYSFRQFHILPDFFSIPDLRRLVLANGYASMVVALVGWEELVGYDPPGGVLAIDFLLCLLAITGIRLGLRLRREQLRQRPVNVDIPARRVGIVGAGEAGAILARELHARRGLGLVPVAFFDDDARKWDAEVYDIPVIGRPDVLLTEVKDRLKLDEVVISMPSAPPKRIREVISICRKPA